MEQDSENLVSPSTESRQTQYVHLTLIQLLVLLAGTVVFTLAIVFCYTLVLRESSGSRYWSPGSSSIVIEQASTTPGVSLATTTALKGCPTEERLCGDGVTKVTREGEACEFTECPALHPLVGNGMEEGVACASDTQKCSDGTILHRMPPSCVFPRCTTDAGVYGRCVTNADCPTTTTCQDASAVSRPGMEAKRCWPKNEPLPQ